jgi:hypothetical protein
MFDVCPKLLSAALSCSLYLFVPFKPYLCKPLKHHACEVQTGWCAVCPWEADRQIGRSRAVARTLPLAGAGPRRSPDDGGRFPAYMAVTRSSQQARCRSTPINEFEVCKLCFSRVGRCGDAIQMLDEFCRTDRKYKVVSWWSIMPKRSA